jgi:hypothetical protein
MVRKETPMKIEDMHPLTILALVFGALPSLLAVLALAGSVLSHVTH